MLNYSEISSMTIKDLIENHIELNEELVASIFKNPIIRDLPSLASLYGFYGRFVIGQTKIFFAYGIDPDVINGAFHEALDTVIPDYVVQKCGYFVSSGTTLLCPRCEVFEIPVNNFNDIDGLRVRMSMLERIIHEYKSFGLPLPEYIDADTSDFRKLKDLYHVTDNRTILEDGAKERRRKQERQLLQDMAIWEWPITLHGVKPGFTAFCGWSRYSIHSTDLEESLRVYNTPRLWQGIFESEKMGAYRSFFRMPKAQAEFIMRGLDRMKIPYCRYVEDKSIRKANTWEKKNLKSVLPDTLGTAEELIAFFVCENDEGAVAYWVQEYKKTLFTKEQLQYGEELYYGTDWWNKGQDPAGYLFFVSDADFPLFMEWAKGQNVKVGYPGAGWMLNSYQTGFYLISEYSNMPSINAILNTYQHYTFSFHQIGIEGNAPYENRQFHQNKKGVYIRQSQWHYLNKNEVLEDTPWYRTIDELVQNGTMADNRKLSARQSPIGKSHKEPDSKKRTSKLSFMDLLKQI